MIEAQQAYENVDEIPAELASTLLTWLLAVADTKHRIGMQFSHWVTGTPALEAAVGAAAMTQDELGHARSIYALLRDFPDAPAAIGAENDLEARDVYYTPNALMPRWESWLQVVAINTLLDRALQIAIAQMQGSAYGPMASRVAKILQEEQFHRVFGTSWIERLVQQNDETKARLQEAIDWAWSITNEWIGPDDDPIANQLMDAGVLRGNAATIRSLWLAEVEPILRENGLTVPDREVDWTRWNGQLRQIDHA